MTTELADTGRADTARLDGRAEHKQGSIMRTGMQGGGGGEPPAWAKVQAALKAELGEDTYGSWIAPARLRRAPDAWVMVALTGYARDWIRRGPWREVQALWSRYDGSGLPLELRSRHDFEAEFGDRAVDASAPDQPAARPVVVASNEVAVVRPVGLQERYQFEGFVAGPSNEFAVSVSRRIASWADGCFNPVLFHGPYGFGKTHLLNAIGWEASRSQPGRRVVYMSAADFTGNFVRALQEKQVQAFKDQVRKADLLLIDDVQFIGGKKVSEEELFHTLQALIAENRRIVFCSDRPPEALSEIDARLRSHLGSGLVCGIEAPDRALRLGILERKIQLLSRSLGYELKARPELLSFLADRFPVNVRELEGGLSTLVAKAGERLSTLGVDEAQSFLRAHLRSGIERKITVDEIQKTVADHFGLKKDDMLSERRTRAVARPRQMAMYLCKMLTVRSYPDIGRRFGGRDHTTVLHAVRRIEQLKAEDATLAADLEAIIRKLKD